MFCSRCGCTLPSVAKFCVRCGSQVEAHLDATTPLPMPPQQVADITNHESRKAIFLTAENRPLHPYSEGNRFVISKDSVLPNCCVKCGNSPTEPWLLKTFSWHSPLLYFLIISPVIYVIVALIVRKQIRLAVPLCKAHKSIRKSRLWIGGALLTGCLPVTLFIAAYVENEQNTGVAIWLGIAMFVVGLVFLAMASPLRPKRIGIESAEFSGAGKEFLAILNSVPEQASGTAMGSPR